MIRAECIRACTWFGRYWAVRNVYEGTETPPRHFKILEAAEDGSGGGGQGCGCKVASEEDVDAMMDELIAQSRGAAA